MDEKNIKKFIRQIRDGKLSETRALKELKKLPFTDLGHTKVDHHRALRQGAAEVIFAEGKTTNQIVAIIREMVKAGSEVLVTRLGDAQARVLKKKFPKGAHNQIGRTMRVSAGRTLKGRKKKAAGHEKKGSVAIVSAGTADAPVVEEIKETLVWLGIDSEIIADAGVAGIHRLLAFQEVLNSARVIIVVAGMEGALASVVGGLVQSPVIGVPVSVGYGAGAGGIAALLGMLNSCASGVMVMNIDNGFGAACAASRILRSGESK